MDVVAGTRQTFIPDLQGSVLATLDSGTGALTKRGYLPYGASASVTGSFAYAGQRIDAETSGLYYARARMYSSVLGRFLQPDPIGYAGGPHLYAYVGNDPLNRTDPRGLVDIFIGGKWDYPVGPVMTYYRQYTQMHPTFIATYFEHDEAEAIRKYIAVQPPGEPIKIVGHSYGAHTAAQVAASVNRRVDLLITIDPVGSRDTGDFVRNVTTWVSVTAAPSEPRFPDDVIANLGGKGGNLPTEQATSTYNLNVHHGEFAVMMNVEPAGRSSPLNILRTTPSPSTPGLGTSVAPSAPGK